MNTRIGWALLTLALCAQGAGAKCFPTDIATVVYSTATHFGTIISSDKAPSGCNLTVDINGIPITGTAKAALLCHSKVGAGVALRTRPYCCDEPPCTAGEGGEIRFRLPKSIGSHKTVGELFEADTKDIEITIREWADFGKLAQRKDFGDKEIALFRKDLDGYVEISDAEHESIVASLIGMGDRAGTMRIPNKYLFEWRQNNYLTVRITMAGAKARTLIFAPREWLKLIQW